MGTTAEKLQKILDTKSALKTAINAKGGTITDTTLFSDYATQVNNLPTLTYWDGTYEESDGESGYTLTLNSNSLVVQSSSHTYSLDSGSTWNRFTSTTMTLENVEKIRFKIENSSNILCVGTTSGGDDIARITNTETGDLTLTDNTVWYVSLTSDGGILD